MTMARPIRPVCYQGEMGMQGSQLSAIPRQVLWFVALHRLSSHDLFHLHVSQATSEKRRVYKPGRQFLGTHCFMQYPTLSFRWVSLYTLLLFYTSVHILLFYRYILIISLNVWTRVFRSEKSISRESTGNLASRFIALRPSTWKLE